MERTAGISINLTRDNAYPGYHWAASNGWGTKVSGTAPTYLEASRAAIKAFQTIECEPVCDRNPT